MIRSAMNIRPDENRSSALPRGTRIAHFTIDQPIAFGGMGEVYLAEDADLKRQVVLKLLPPRWSEDRVRREQLRREAQAAAGFTHPFAVTVYEIGEHEGSTYIAMEYIRGESLRSRMTRERLTAPEIG